MDAVGIIPARWASSRFPGKPLAKIAGRPMIQWTWEGARTASSLRDVVIATDDARIAEAARAFGASVALTGSHHPTGTDRLAEVAAGLDDDLVVNIQGDEPLITGFVIDAAVAALIEDASADMSTVVHALAPGAADDPNRVKARLDDQGRALDFARRPTEPGFIWQHVGLYAYRRSFALKFVSLARTERECSEGLEQLRALDHGHTIRAAIVEDWHSVPVDVPEDVARVEAMLRSADR
jgi:3-deoxy-manno-octulosonate cytidylyltransferase (CMP-KDO synthetase)